jgi:hypothetical protein
VAIVAQVSGSPCIRSLRDLRHIHPDGGHNGVVVWMLISDPDDERSFSEVRPVGEYDLQVATSLNVVGPSGGML